MPHDPITIVLPWYGPETRGGAEDQARHLVRALRTAGIAVDVWATNARDARAPLAPFYPLGQDEVDGTRVRRFPANLGAGPRLTRRSATQLPSFPIHELHLLQSLTGSDQLLEALLHERATRRWVFFLYAFPTSFWGAQIAADRAYLVSRCTPIEDLDPERMGGARGVQDFRTDAELEYLRSDAQPACEA